MRISFGPVLALLTVACAGIAAGQQSSPASTVTSPPTLLHAGTQLVIVDVVVEDRSGHPVLGLPRDSFQVTEQKKPQTIRHFEEHSAATADKPLPQLPPLPPGTFTDYTAVPPGALNILLIDALNTPMKDQTFVREQLLDFVKHEKPGTRIAIFGLNSNLYMLQGFTSDPALLKDAIERGLGARSSVLLEDPSGSNTNPKKLSEALADAQAATGMGDPATVAAIQQFEAEQAVLKIDLRVKDTMDAFNAIAHYLANFPGRKNLIWFSGSFPLNIMPDSSIEQPFNVMEMNNDEFLQTSSLLARAQVAVYPVDARGLMLPPTFDASRRSSNAALHPQAFNNDLSKFYGDQATEHQTMNLIAADTGGHAFYNTNGLAGAVEKAIDSGSNFYTLTYSPTDHKWDGAYRKIDVKLTGAAARGLHLSYRQGYFADDPEHSIKHSQRATTTAAPATAPEDRAAKAYSRAALSRGAPTPEDILFKVRVLPVSTTTDDKIALRNSPNASGKMKAPYRQYAVDYVAVPGDFTFTTQPDGHRQSDIEAAVLVYDADGNLLNQVADHVQVELTPQAYKTVLASGVRFHLNVSAPARQQSFLRIMMHDVPSNHYGVVEIPTRQVSPLPPLAQPSAASKSPQSQPQALPASPNSPTKR